MEKGIEAKKINWGILGTSFISGIMAEAMQSSDTGVSYAVVSRSENTAREFAQKYHLQKHYVNHDDLLNDPDIDVIYIALPNHLHRDFVMRAVLAGKHVLCEKPFTLDAAGARQAYAAAAQSNVQCMEGLMYLHHPFTRKIQEIVRQKTIGDIRQIHAFYSADIAAVANSAAGGGIRNLGCYPVSLVRLLMAQEPLNMTALGRINTETKNDSQASLIMQFAGNAMAVVSASDDMEMHWQFEVIGSEGYLKAITNPWWPEQENNQLIVKRYADANAQLISVNADKPLFSYQIDEMCNRIHDRASDLVSPAFSIGNVAVLEKWVEMVGDL